VNASKQKQLTRWGYIIGVAILLILVIGGAIYAQAGPRQGRNGGGEGNHPRMGQGFGPGPGQGMRPGMERGQGPGMGQGRGMQAMFGARFLMQEPEIMELMMQIRTIQGINRLDLSTDQVVAMRDLAIEAQRITENEFGSTRDEIKTALERELDSVIAGNEHDPGFIREILEGARDQHEPGALREEMEGILGRAQEILTDEQVEMLIEDQGPMPEIREREQNWHNQDGPGQRWFNDLNDDERDRVEQQYRNRLNNMSEQRAMGKIMMLLMSPNAVESMDLWLEAH